MSQITLYHYTTDDNARRIESEKYLRSSNSSTTSEQHRKHGDGVYFTALGPDTDPKILVGNNFTSRGVNAGKGNALFRKISSVVEITFQENEVSKIRDRGRDLYLYKGSINLDNYRGKYKVYKNPKYPGTQLYPTFSFF